jgi:thiamine biosynthesis lipoprotein
MTGTAAAVPVRHAEPCMGTVFSFDIRSPGVDWSDFARALRRIQELDARFSTYRPDSEISRIRNGALRPADAHPDVRAVLAECARAERLTDGYFSAYAAGQLDPSGYVKGWAVRVASDMLVTAGSANHCVNGGGDVLCVGRPAPDRDWHVGIAHPLRPGELLQTVGGSRQFAVATSGTAERGTHIVDPHTGHRPAEVVSVTVIGCDIVLADVLATAALAMGAKCVDWLRARDDVRALVVHRDGAVSDTLWGGRRDVTTVLTA